VIVQVQWMGYENRRFSISRYLEDNTR